MNAEKTAAQIQRAFVALIDEARKVVYTHRGSGSDDELKDAARMLGESLDAWDKLVIGAALEIMSSKDGA